MKNLFDFKYMKIAFYTCIVLIVAILTYKLSSTTDNILPAINSFISHVMHILSPILCGLLIAYLMNPLVNFFERNIIRFTHVKRGTHLGYIRMLSIILVYICVIGTVVLSFRFLVPQILDNIRSLMINVPDYVAEVKELLFAVNANVNDNLATLPFEVSIDMNQVFNYLNNASWFSLNSLNSLLDTLLSHTLSLSSTLLNLVIGLVIAMYALTQKETFVNGSTRITYALFKKPTADKILSLSKETHLMITRFFVGKSLDSLIIGVLCYLGLVVMKNPYALLLALIVGVCNMIPYFGPVIGAVPAVIITLFEGLGPAVLVLVFILILQQFDGLILGPKILGDSIGLRPFWIISAITIGGALWGPLGMFFASPILAVILLTLNRWIDKRLVVKDIDLPQTTYEDSLEDNARQLK